MLGRLRCALSPKQSERRRTVECVRLWLRAGPFQNRHGGVEVIGGIPGARRREIGLHSDGRRQREPLDARGHRDLDTGAADMQM